MKIKNTKKFNFWILIFFSIFISYIIAFGHLAVMRVESPLYGVDNLDVSNFVISTILFYFLVKMFIFVNLDRFHYFSKIISEKYKKFHLLTFLPYAINGAISLFLFIISIYLHDVGYRMGGGNYTSSLFLIKKINLIIPVAFFVSLVLTPAIQINLIRKTENVKSAKSIIAILGAYLIFLFLLVIFAVVLWLILTVIREGSYLTF